MAATKTSISASYSTNNASSYANITSYNCTIYSLVATNNSINSSANSDSTKVAQITQFVLKWNKMEQNRSTIISRIWSKNYLIWTQKG